MLVCNMMESDKDRGTELVSTRVNRFHGDPRQKFMNEKHLPGNGKFLEDKEDEDGDDIELSLGLSLNGRFGLDPKRAKNLIRSSSISNLTMTPPDENFSLPLTRTCSLPTETEVEWRKRKELQSRRRMEAKRKRLEKLRNGRMVGDKSDNCEETGKKLGVEVGFVGLSPPQLSSQGSIGSQGSGCSGLSDLESQPIQGTNKYSSSVHSVSEQTDWKSVIKLKATTTTNGVRKKFDGAAMEKSLDKAGATEKDGKEVGRNVLLDMPCVSTVGDGPNGKRIEGFLYRYRKGEEVRIVCVCHGSFLSPAEFVKHAGGGDVKHPLKHIVVYTSPLF